MNVINIRIFQNCAHKNLRSGSNTPSAPHHINFLKPKNTLLFQIFYVFIIQNRFGIKMNIYCKSWQKNICKMHHLGNIFMRNNTNRLHCHYLLFPNSTNVICKLKTMPVFFYYLKHDLSLITCNLSLIPFSSISMYPQAFHLIYQTALLSYKD